MAGNDFILDVYLDTQMIAKLSLTEDKLLWHYEPGWQQSGYPVSPHLPLMGDIPSINVHRFIRNLLPEGDRLDELAQSFHLTKNNIFGLIRALGLDTSGALILVEQGKSLTQPARFRKIPNHELEERLNHREHFSLIIWDNKPRLSVAGIQDKINVILDQNNQLGFGEGSLCSTHILKFEKQQSSHLVLNEFITMQLAKACGLSVAQVELLRFGKHPALLVKRFDRQYKTPKEIQRHHLIDGCQALNFPPDYKYERIFGSSRDVAHIRDGTSLVRLFNFADQCTNPALTKQHILNWVLFNILIFNYDAHGKNISFFVAPSGISLAPFYDLVNIKLYPDFAQEMAMAIGDEFDGDMINAYQLADFAHSCSLKRTLVASQLNKMTNKLLPALHNNINLEHYNHEEAQYLKKYKAIVSQRCQHLLTQVSEISSIEL